MELRPATPNDVKGIKTLFERDATISENIFPNCEIEKSMFELIVTSSQLNFIFIYLFSFVTFIRINSL